MFKPKRGPEDPMASKLVLEEVMYFIWSTIPYLDVFLIIALNLYRFVALKRIHL